jgi:hypothetical protein
LILETSESLAVVFGVIFLLKKRKEMASSNEWFTKYLFRAWCECFAAWYSHLVSRR